MKKLLYTLIVITVFSCKPTIKKLGANPKVSYYIVGRLKTAEVDNNIPFEVKVIDLNPQLIEQPIKMRIRDVEHFEISYSLNDNDERKECLFGKEINEKNMHLLISKTSSLDTAIVKYIKEIDFQFQVKGEKEK